MTLVAAADPGHNITGVVLYDDTRSRLVAWDRIARDELDAEGLPAWARHCATRFEVFVLEHQAVTGERIHTACEGVVPPNPHVGRRRGQAPKFIDVGPVFSACGVWCAIATQLPATITIRPQGFSALATQRRNILEQLFPAELCTPPLPALKDVRSAYLVAQEAAKRIRAAEGHTGHRTIRHHPSRTPDDQETTA